MIATKTIITAIMNLSCFEWTENHSPNPIEYVDDVDIDYMGKGANKVR